MAQARMLRKDICESDSFAAINDAKAQLLCCLLTPWWDDHGKMIGEEAWIKGNIVRKLKFFTEKEISRCLKLINDRTDAHWWVDEKGNKWLYWPKFNTHQSISEAKKTKDTLPSPRIPKNPQEKSATREVEDKISRREVEVEDGYAAFEKAALNNWNSFCNNHPLLTKIKEISDTRRQKLKKRYEKESFRDFTKIIQAISEQPFLINGNPKSKDHKDWKISFDWIIDNDTNYLKVLERRYKSSTNDQDLRAQFGLKER